MELKEFIEETVIQIVEGVKLAQEKTKASGAIINPADAKSSTPELHTDDRRYIGAIDFEVALTNTDGTAGKSGIGVWFAGVGLGGEAKTEIKNISATSVRFSIPVVLPKQER